MQIAMGTFVSYFFSGFILGKIPFPLSPSFRLMLQVRNSLERVASTSVYRVYAVGATSHSLILQACCAPAAQSPDLLPHRLCSLAVK